VHVGISLNEDLPVARQQELAADIEAAGLASMWANDATGRDPFLLCQAWGQATSSIRLGIGVAQALTRSPAQCAKAAATLQEATGGRFVLGLGASQPEALQWHGVGGDRPLSAVRDALEVIRAATSGETTDHDGVLSSHGFRLGISPLPAPVPLYVGAMKPRALALAGTHADGVLLSWESPGAVAHAAAAVRSAARTAGRPAPEIAAYVRVAVDDDPDTARAALARQVAFYWRFYADHFGTQAPPASVAAAERAYRRGGATRLSDALDDDLLETLGWWGTPDDDVSHFLGRFEAAGLEHAVVRVVPTADPVTSLEQTLGLLASYTREPVS
jgi:5,10-methylenetetrahydromethanopterin reductase